MLGGEEVSGELLEVETLAREAQLSLKAAREDRRRLAKLLARVQKQLELLASKDQSQGAQSHGRMPVVQLESLWPFFAEVARHGCLLPNLNACPCFVLHLW